MNTDKMDKMGGRKFIIVLLTIAFLIFITVVMLIFKWLTGDYCMRLVGSAVMVAGMFFGANTGEHYIKNKGGKK